MLWIIICLKLKKWVLSRKHILRLKDLIIQQIIGKDLPKIVNKNYKNPKSNLIIKLIKYIANIANN